MFISVSHSNLEEMTVSCRSGCPRAMRCLPTTAVLFCWCHFYGVWLMDQCINIQNNAGMSTYANLGGQAAYCNLN